MMVSGFRLRVVVQLPGCIGQCTPSLDVAGFPGRDRSHAHPRHDKLLDDSFDCVHGFFLCDAA